MQELSACPVCRSDQVKLDYSGRTMRRPEDATEWPVFHCGNCDHGFLNPQPSWDELQPYYDAAYDPYEEDHGIAGFEAELAKARETGKLRHVEIRPGMRLLDVGCGGGAFLRLARELGAIVQGVEPSPHGAATTAKAGIPVFNGSLDSYLATDPPERFDLITSNHVVEHHPDPVALLGEMKRLLAPGGRIWFSVPNAGCRSARRLNWRWHSTDLPYHLMQFSPESVRRTAGKAGLKVAHMETESIPEIVRHSMWTEWRRRFLIPIRLTMRLPILPFARAKARRMDRDCAGEAILTELVPA